MFSKSLNIFGSQWQVVHDPFSLGKDDSVQLDPKDAFGESSPYPFGIDPVSYNTQLNQSHCCDLVFDIYLVIENIESVIETCFRFGKWRKTSWIF